MLVCRSCGKVWKEEDRGTGFYFSSASLRKGSYASPFAIASLGEEILTCPADPISHVDEAMREGDRVQDYDLEGEEQP
jgi:hypothetical protein